MDCPVPERRALPSGRPRFISLDRRTCDYRGCKERATDALIDSDRRYLGRYCPRHALEFHDRIVAARLGRQT